MDKKLNLNLSLNKASFGKIFKNLSWLFFAVFLMLLVFEGFEIQSSVALVMQLNQTPALDQPSKNNVDRVDFATYDKNLQKQQDAQMFTPSGGITYDPFNGIGTPPSQPASTTQATFPLPTSTPPAATGTP